MLKKKKKTIKLFGSLGLCLILLFSSILFPACSSTFDETGNETTFFEQYIDSFKVVCSNSLDPDNNSDIVDLTYDVTQQLIIGLNHRYGLSESNPNKRFYDSIRMLVYEDTEVIEVDEEEKTLAGFYDKRWRWTINDNLTGIWIDKDHLIPNDEDGFKDWIINVKDSLISSYDYNFTSTYSDALQVVLYEIMLGYDLTTFSVQFGEEEGVTEVTIAECPGKSSLKGKNVNDPAVDNYKEELFDKYVKNTKYIGLTKDNSDRLIDYILTEVIGELLVAFDYKTFGPEQTEYRRELTEEELEEKAFNYAVNIEGKWYDFYNYRNYVETVANIVYGMTYDGVSDFTYEKTLNIDGQNKKISYKFTGEEGDFEKRGFSASPATFFTSFQGETFFEEVSETGEDLEFTFGVAPKAEYQSIVMISNPKNDFEIEAGIPFNILAYDRNLKVNIKVRFYYWNQTTQTGTLYEFLVDPLDFTNAERIYDPTSGVQKFGYYNDFEVGFDIDKIKDTSLISNKSGDPVFTIPHITNSDFKDIGSNGKEINLVDEKIAAGFYKVENSKNGYGGITILDERKMQCSFYEIVFDIVKSPEDSVDMDYTFKVTVGPLIV